MRKIVLSKKAAKQLGSLLEYLENDWSANIKEGFVKKLDKSFNQIKKYPESCQQTDFIKGVFMLIITKQTSAFYKYNNQTITILSFFDNRMNPKKRQDNLID